MKGILKLVGFYIVLTLPTVLLAEILPHIFNAGDPAKASEVNANFNFLLEEIEKQKIGANTGFSHSVDCDLNSSALSEAVEAGYPRIEVSGAECVDPELGTDTDAQNVTNSESSGVALKWNEGNWNETDWK